MSGRLLGNALLGEGQGGAVGSKPRFIGPPYYLVNDTFTTDRAAGAVNGTRAEPGPGGRVVNDTENKLSLSGGACSIAPRTSPTNGDPAFWLSGFPRQGGRMLIAQVTPGATNKAFDIGWDSNQAGGISGPAIMFRGTGAITERVLGAPQMALRTFTATAYPVAVILRETAGHLLFVKDGSNWLLLWVGSNGTYATMYPNLSNFDATATCGYIRVPSTLWLPTPLASDGFSSWGTTNGLGHQEGVAGGLGSGGNGLSWTSAVGTWGASGGAAAASALSGGVAVAVVDTSKADAIVTAKLTRNGGTAGVVCRWVDANNHVQGRHTGTNAQLVKVVSGTPTTLIDAAATYAAGAEVRVICEGQKFRLYYNNAMIGSEQTIADAALASATKQGLRTTDTTNTFDDFVVRARGTGGEYSALDNY